MLWAGILGGIKRSKHRDSKPLSATRLHRRQRPKLPPGCERSPQACHATLNSFLVLNLKSLAGGHFPSLLLLFLSVTHNPHEGHSVPQLPLRVSSPVSWQIPIHPAYRINEKPLNLPPRYSSIHPLSFALVSLE